MKNIKISADNLEVCAELFVQVFNQPPWNECWDFSGAFERMKFYFDTPNFVGICFYDGDNLLGFVMGNYEPYQREKLFVLKEMCVSPESQRKGIGSRLLADLHVLLKDKGISAVNLITQTGGLPENFYLKNGYYRSQRMGLYVARIV